MALESLPYGNVWNNAEMAPVPMLTACHAGVKCLMRSLKGFDSEQRLIS